MFSNFSIFITIVFAFYSSNSLAQVSESCDCSVDTLGYASFLETIDPNEDAIFQLHAHNNFAVAYGTIDSNTPAVIQDLVNNHPEVTTIIMYACPGSEDDDANLVASELIFEAELKMYLPIDGWVASGAVDMFLAGSTRVIDATYDPVGVHSWSDGTSEATDFPVGAPEHQLYIDYYISIGFSLADAEAFYYFTINASPADEIYWMTDAEIDHFKIRTCIYSENPNYSISVSNSTLTVDLGNAEYQWIDCDDNNALISGATDQIFAPAQSGNYAVTVTEEGCSANADCVSVIVSGIAKLENGVRISIYPNPMKEEFYIEVEEGSPISKVTIIDCFGKVIQSNTIFDNDLIHLEFNAPSGLYFVQIETKSEAVVYKLVKE